MHLCSFQQVRRTISRFSDERVKLIIGNYSIVAVPVCRDSLADSQMSRFLSLTKLVDIVICSDLYSLYPGVSILNFMERPFEIQKYDFSIFFDKKAMALTTVSSRDHTKGLRVSNAEPTLCSPVTALNYTSDFEF